MITPLAIYICLNLLTAGEGFIMICLANSIFRAWLGMVLCISGMMMLGFNVAEYINLSGRIAQWFALLRSS